MIDTKQIRRGNLVHATEGLGIYPAGIIEVEQILDDGVNLSHGDMTVYASENLEGIPITSEWLKRFGGIQPYDDDLSRWQIGLFTFKLHDEFGLCQWDEEGDCIIFGTIHYRFIHQLQNLYFALTGEELTIKE